MESISINAIIITINRMWNEERDLRPFYSKVPKRKQILSVRNMKKKNVPSTGNLLQKFQSINHCSI